LQYFDELIRSEKRLQRWDLSMGKMLILLGLGIALLGVLLLVGDKIPLLGKLPGDIVIRRKNMVFYFPLATCLLISLLLTIFLYFFQKK
jgi:hypothetical protein